jgi:ketosteroid isomerase-like protein
MSEENVEVVKQLFRAWAERDAESAIKLIHPEVQFDFSAIAALGDEFGAGESSEALHDRVESWFGVFGSLEFRPAHFIDVGDHVIVLLSATGRGRQSGVPLEWRVAAVYTLRDGLVVSFRAFDKLADAAASVDV